MWGVEDQVGDRKSKRTPNTFLTASILMWPRGTSPFLFDLFIFAGHWGVRHKALKSLEPKRKQMPTDIHIFTYHTYIYIYIYTSTCVCRYICIYIYIYMCILVGQGGNSLSGSCAFSSHGHHCRHCQPVGAVDSLALPRKRREQVLTLLTRLQSCWFRTLRLEYARRG